MKIKNRFYILMFSPIVLTLIIMLSASSILSFFESGFAFSNKTHKQIAGIVSSLSLSDSEETVINTISQIPLEFNVQLISNDKIIYQNESNLLLKTKNDINSYLSFSKKFTIQDGSKYIVVMSNSKIFQFISKTLALIIFTICFVVCFITFYSVKQLNNHLKKIERATIKIAEGDYDTPLTVDNNDTFTSLEQSINTMREKIKEEQNRRARFFAGVSHDLKTPLSSIIGYSQALKDGLADNDITQNKYIEIIYDKGTVLEQRISSLIEYIKMNDNGFITNLEEIELLPFLKEFSKLEKIELSLLGISVESQFEINRNYRTVFDTVLLNRALENIIQNAIKYGDITKPIMFEGFQNYDGVTISIKNYNKTESKLSKEIISHIFEPFYRADNSRRGKGFGLGLASVKSIIESHGWKIKAEVKEEENTTVFSITIPCY